ncbi:arsenite efflux membrane protein ArsB [Actinomycetospora succinea]|uniref:Arsenite efflux membrane protein ArsB n=1 Tax=Actinomycetospora succinea TaxID=663603 RepID=A0A4R6V9B1_9PSEU|nr:SLC13 family permease [Actinomycetospora succinea]TDQ55806.1 arsenite efflux membrane protein ArsB [Actinomycetospora succinea]
MTVLAVALLAAVLVVAVTRPRALPEASAAVPAAAVVLLTGLLGVQQAWDEVRELGPTVGFLAAVLVLAHLADAEGVFRWAGGLLAHHSQHRPRRLFVLVVVAALLTTTVLSLDATVVLLTPVVLDTARRLGARPAPHAFACAHLANSGSLLLPVANLTNLLALQASGLTFLGFAGLMLLPQLAVLVVEYAGLRLTFRRDLAVPADPRGPDEEAPVPRVALAVLGATLLGFAVVSPLGVEPVWVAVAGAAVLAVRTLVTRRTRVRDVVGAASPLFCLFVLALGVVVAAVTQQGLGDLVAGLLPAGTSFAALLGLAVIGAVLANVVNNLPATLVLLAALGPAPAVGAVLAVLIGVNVGPNLTPVGSLATLLWRRVLAARGVPAPLGTFTVAGLATVPACLLAGTGALAVVLSW